MDKECTRGKGFRQRLGGDSDWKIETLEKSSELEQFQQGAVTPKIIYREYQLFKKI
jgi:hypothetical protein